MNEENRDAPQPERRSPWVTIGKVLLYVCGVGVLLVLLVFGTCVLLLRG